MIAGIGMDIIEIDRIKKALTKEAFRLRVFTPAEQEYCEARGKGRAASYAARFAGKEAVLKALGTGLTGGAWQDIEILPNAAGQPQVTLFGYFRDVAEGKQIQEILISLTHAQEYAAAQAIAIGRDGYEGCNCSRNENG